MKGVKESQFNGGTAKLISMYSMPTWFRSWKKLITISLKTVIPNRKAPRDYLKGGV